MRFDQVPTEIVLRAGQGLAGFEELHQLISPDVYALAFSLLQDHEDTEEVFQEVMLRLFRHLRHLSDVGSFGPWTTRIIVNAVRSLQARKSQLITRGGIGAGGLDDRDRIPIPEAIDRSAGPAELADSRELSGAVRKALTRLPPRQREAVLLFEMRGHTLAEVASIMECSPGAVKFHLHEGRQKLRESLVQWMGGEGVSS